MALSTNFPSVEFTESRLKNGLRVVLSVDRTSPIVGINLWYNVGSRDEAPGKTGLAHLFEHMMFEGSANLSKGDHFNLITAVGGIANATTSQVRTNYFEWAPSHELEMLLWLEADRLGGLLKALNQKTLDNQRDVVKNERRQGIDNVPYGAWQEAALSSVFPEGHPYHHSVIGSMDDLTEASLKDVKDFFSTHYAPNNAVLSIVGDFDPKEALAWVEKYFGKIPSNPKLPKRPEVDLPLPIGAEFRDTLRDRVPVPGVFINYRAPGDGTRESDIMTVGAAVLGLGQGSRMYQRLTRELYSLEAVFFYDAAPGVSMCTAVGISAPGVFNEMLEEQMHKVIDSLKTEPVTESELARVKAQLERSVIDQISSVAGKADWLSEHATLYGDPGRVNDRLPELLSVTADEIQKVANEVLREDNRSVITFLPKPPEVKKKKRGR